MPVLGADPDVEYKEFPEFTPTLFMSRPVRGLVDYFAYHRGMKMLQRCNDTDRAILGRFFKQSLGRGYTESTLKSMTDKFWQSWGGDTDVPALSFVSSEMQDKLQQERKISDERPEVDETGDVEIKARMTKHVFDDKYLKWLFEGMPDTGIEGAREYRKLVVIHSKGLELRYPEVVADILRLERSEKWTIGALRYVNDLVQWNLGEIDDAPDGADYDWHLDLPGELATKRQTKSKIRVKRATINRAIASMPNREK